MKVRKGKIVRLDANRLSGVAELVVDEMIAGEEKRVAVPCDHAFTSRVISGSPFASEARPLIGMEIFFVVDNGVLAEIAPVEDAPPELVRIYEEAIP